jgi:hypothetical protein
MYKQDFGAKVQHGNILTTHGGQIFISACDIVNHIVRIPAQTKPLLRWKSSDPECQASRADFLIPRRSVWG